MPPPHSHGRMGVLTLHGMIVGSRVFGRWSGLCHEDGTPLMRDESSTLGRRDQISLSLHPPCDGSASMPPSANQEEDLLRTQPCWYLDCRLQPPGLWDINVGCLSIPIYDILLHSLGWLIYTPHINSVIICFGWYAKTLLFLNFGGR